VAVAVAALQSGGQMFTDEESAHMHFVYNFEWKFRASVVEYQKP
jgi:hypothetical protein